MQAVFGPAQQAGTRCTQASVDPGEPKHQLALGDRGCQQTLPSAEGGELRIVGQNVVEKGGAAARNTQDEHGLANGNSAVASKQQFIEQEAAPVDQLQEHEAGYEQQGDQ